MEEEKLATKNKAGQSPALKPKAKARKDEGPETTEAPPKGQPKAKAKAKAKKTLDDEFQDLMADVEAKPKAPKATAKENPDEPEVAGQPSSSSGRMVHGVTLIEGKSRKWWARQNVTVIKNQAELLGHYFSDLDTKGGPVKKDGKLVKSPSMKKPAYLNVLYGLLKI